MFGFKPSLKVISYLKLDSMTHIVMEITKEEPGIFKQRQLCIQMDRLTSGKSDYHVFIKWLL